MDHSRLHRFLHMMSLLTVLALLTSSFPSIATPQAVQAQIDNSSPTQAYASAVDCIRSASDLGSPRSFDSPRFAVSCFSSAWDIVRYEQPGNPANGDAPYTDAAVYEFGDGLPNQTQTEPGHTSIASIGTNGSNGGGIGLGAVYGLAYASDTNPAAPYYNAALGSRPRMYAAAFAKRVTRFGSGGPGAIYLLDRTTNNETLYVQIPAIVPGPPGAAGSPGNGFGATFPNGTNAATYTPEMGGVHRVQHDDDLRALAGRVGLGDLDLDPQERFLYTVNLLTKEIYRVDTWSANPQASIVGIPSHPIFSDPNSCNVSGASGPADLRTFGLAVTSDSLYLGFVCSAENSQNRSDMGAGVIRYDLTTNSWAPGFAMSFLFTDYDTQRQWPSPSFSNTSRWQPWRANDTGSAAPVGGTFRIEPQPLIADIDFDENGRMILGLRDRFGDIGLTPFTSPTYPMAQGDILYATPTGNYSWATPTTAVEYFNDNSPFASMPEEAAGSLAYIPGTHTGAYGGEVISSVMDPYGSNSAGMAWFDISGGNRTSSEELYFQQPNSTRFAKASGLGDVEILCAWRAIGDRIWRDTNGNGQQDGGENDINGVLLNLRDSNGNLVTQATTGSVAGMSGNYRFYVNPYQNYTIEIDPSNYASGRPLFGLGSSAANVGSDSSDSDASAAGQISVASAGNRDVNISFDAGFTTGANVRIQKSGTPSAALGTSFSYTLSYTNDGPSSAANVGIIDILPGGISYASATPPPSSISGQTLTWNLGTLATGTSGSITIVVNVQASAPGSVTNTATITTSTSGDIPGDNTSSTTTQITRPNVTITKTGPLTAAVGSTISYGLTARNTGNALAAGTQVVDTLPIGLNYLSASPAPASVSGQVLTWNAGTLSIGASTSFSIQAQVTTSAANSVVNNATITTSSQGDDPNDNSSSVTTTIQRPNVTISKTGSATVTAGEGMAYTLTYRNTGTASATSVSLTDTLPAGISYLNASPAPSMVSGQILTWNLGSLAAGTVGTITLNVTSAASLANGTSVVNNATITTTAQGDDPNDNSSSSTTTVQRTDVYISKSSPTTFPVVSGQSVTYVIDYGNNGPATARSVQLVDSIPAQLSGIAWSCVSGCSVSGSGNISVAVGDLVAGATGRITVSGTANTTSAREDFSNTATISTTTPETSTANNSSSVPGAVWTSDLQVIKLADAQVIAGNTFTATLQYRNNGPASAANVVLTDTLPSDVAFISAIPAPSSQSGNTLSWDLGSLADSAAGSITLSLRSAATLADGTSLVNTAQITTSTADRTSSNNTATATTQVLTRADLRVTKAGPANVNLGDLVTYTLSYANSGPSVARSVIISDTLPTELDFSNATPAPTTNTGRVLNWNLGDLAVGTTGSITVVLQTRTTQAVNSLPVTNRSAMTSTTSDDNPSDNTSSVTTNILRPDVAIGKNGPGIAQDGQTILYTLVYDNRGAATAANVQVQDTLPTGVQYVSASPAPATRNGQVLTWNLGVLAASGSGVITILATVTPGAAATIVNTATISTPSPGDDPSNNTSSATTTIQRADVSVTKAGPATAIVGDTISYVLDYRVVGTTIAASVMLTDTLPTGLSFVSASIPPSSTSGQEVIFNLGSVSPGTTGRITIQARIDASVPNSATNRASITTTTNGDDPVNNTSTATTAIQRPNVRVQKTAPALVTAGEIFTYTLAYSNTGDAPALNVILTDVLPAGISYVSATPAPSTMSGATLEWNLGALAPAASGSITLTVRANPDPPPTGGSVASIPNTSTIQSISPGDDPGDNTSTATTQVRWPDLAVSKSNGVSVVQPGDLLLYTITITNTGTTTATNILLTETLPMGSSVRSSSWTSVGAGSYTFQIASLAPGASATQVIAIQLPNPVATSIITNTIMVEDRIPGDPTPTDTSFRDVDQVESARIGDFVWRDDDGDSIQDVGEPGLANARIQLLDPTTLVTIATRTSDANGGYLFTGLRAGRYVVQIEPQTTLSGPLAGYRMTTDALHDRTLTSSSNDMSADFGLRPAASTAVTLASFGSRLEGSAVRFDWTTTREIGTDAFLILRGSTPNIGDASEIGRVSSSGTNGGSYRFTDPALPENGAYYWLVEVERDGDQILLVAWPQSAQEQSVEYRVWLPFVGSR